jgi:hypothetical protein
MTPLKVDEQGLPNGWADVQPGDAVVAFSRKDIYRARKVRANVHAQKVHTELQAAFTPACSPTVHAL